MGSGSGFSPVNVSDATRSMLLGDLARHLEAGRGFAVATVNLDHIVKLRRDPGFRAAYLRHTHIVADGNPVVWLHRLAGRSVNLITGSDLVEPLLELAARQGVPVAFFGSSQETLERATKRLTERYPGLVVIARLSPALGFDPASDEAAQAIAAIRASGAQLCLVALGAPKQELFAARAIEMLPGCGFVSIGAGLDFIAGTQRRAPRLWRALAMEWLWRLLSDRKRLARRYLDCGIILPGLVVMALRERFRSPAPTVQIKPAEFRPVSRQTEPMEK